MKSMGAGQDPDGPVTVETSASDDSDSEDGGPPPLEEAESAK